MVVTGPSPTVGGTQEKVRILPPEERISLVAATIADPKHETGVLNK